MDRMRCDLCRKRGLPVGAGIVESACERIVGNRFKRAGRRWSRAGANAVLAIRCCLENKRWPEFHDLILEAQLAAYRPVGPNIIDAVPVLPEPNGPVSPTNPP